MKLATILFGVGLLTLVACKNEGLSVKRVGVLPLPGHHGHSRQRRTMGAGGSFINCLAIGESRQRICSHDLDLLDAIERQQRGGNRSCPEGKVFHRQCNVCKCRRNGAFECSTDLCGEDFFDATGQPRFW